ncbi:hypothetical protein CI109_107391 [Kwoniella shandongensis]|uniref:Uncharacterized protein n=1 Tax=Kwoniella shandongensis TaxID=1734106 RepID=A0A5M6BZT8_9TREE|nr:uncharacterized protein CI109_004681 [Kwoniella shandongensis]KAA5526905.1 hypothetical protein CI109_004681 [Kwoniella shandongensis]
MADYSSFDQPGGPSAPGGYPHSDRSRSPLPRPDRDDDRPGFTRGGFAPIPHRHTDLPPPPPPGRYERDEYDRGRAPRDREFPRRELDPEPEERWERREWDDYDRRPRGAPASHWEDDYDRPKRRRSPSPLGPPSHRPRFHSPSPPPRFGHAALPDPASIETLLSFRNFAEWFRSSHPQTAKIDEEETRKFRELIESGTATEAQAKEKVGMARRYERYRKEFTSRQLYALFLTHRDSAWFKERYSDSPEFAALRRRLNRQGRVPTANRYAEELRAGDWDSADFDMVETDEKTKNRRMSDHEEPEGLDRALGDKGGDWVGDESLRLEIAPKAKQLFVKTAPPTTSRKDLEELFARVPGFQWMALSEPSQKRSFHRVAWAQYADDVDVSEVIQKLDGQKIDGFTFHMSVNSTPTIGRLKVTPPIANTLERLVQDGENAKALALKLEEELLGDDDEQEEEKQEGDGEVTKEVALEKKITGLREKPSDAVQANVDRLIESKGLSGETLTEEEQIQKAKTVLDQWISYLRNGLSTCYYCVAPTSFAEELHRKCIGHVRPHPSVKQQHHELEAVPETEVKAETEQAEADPNAEDVKPPRDGEDQNEDRELRDQEDRSGDRSRRMPGERKAPIFPQKTQEEKWVESLDLKIKPLLGEVDIADYGGRDLEAETKKLCAPLIKQEEPSKYRCKDCNKLFRAPEFVIKHIAVKHPEVMKPKLDDLALLNNFVLDPQHLQPGASTLAAVDDKLVNSQAFGGPAPMMMGAVNPAMIPQNFDSSAGAIAQGPNGAGFNLMQQQMMMMMQMQQAMMMGQMPMAMPGAGGAGPAGQVGGNGLGSRIGGYAGGGGSGSGRDASMSATPMGAALPLPPAPPGGEDPRARRGRVSYQDLDEPGGGGGGGLPY